MDIKERSTASVSKAHRHPWELARVDVVSSLANVFGSDIFEKGSTILDIGCGDGFVITELALRHPGTEFIGIDDALNAEMARTLEMASGLPNVRFYESWDEIDKYYKNIDVVLLLDVLEHIENEIVFLSERVVKKLGTNAGFIFTVPAFQCLFSRRDYFLKHFRRYSYKQLRRIVSEAEVRVIKSGYFFSSLLMPRFVQLLLEKCNLGSPREGTSVGSWKGHPLLGTVTKNILLSDFKFTEWLLSHDILLPGLSCYVVGRK